MPALIRTTGSLRSGQPVVVGVVGVGLAVLTAGEDDPRHLLLLEQHVDVAGLGRCASAVIVHRTGVSPFCASRAPTTSASAGKIGFCSSGSTSPTSRARSPRSLVGRSYPSTSSAVSTVDRVASETPGLLLSTRLTVASLTPARAATSASRLVTTAD